ncbi:MAG: anhydro-N-acetylmuramic acid kinase, partial [Sulfolobales archaeon]
MNLIQRLVEKINLEDRLVAGMMSGTSADGVDIVFVELRGHGRDLKYRVIDSHVIDYPESLRSKILSSIESGTVHDICALNFLVAKFFAKAFREALELSSTKYREIDLIGSHGQTIYHYPEYVKCDELETRCTLQVGSIQVLAEETGVLSIGNFRVRDIAAGGHGAPIIAYVDYILFTHQKIGRIVQNIGGIANATVLPPNASIDDVYAFDTGPGNTLIDFAISILYRDLKYDPGGEIAARGSPDRELLKELMKTPYITKPPPKTTGRETFGRRLVLEFIEKARSRGLSNEDIIATLTMFTVESIARNYELFILPQTKIEEVIVGGGGTKNKTLMRWLEERLRRIGLKIIRHEDLGIDSKIKEALGIAILAHETLSGVPNNIPRATGARRPVVMGEIAL